MYSFQQSRARILFNVACAFGVAASCVVAWMQTYATAMLPVAAIAALYGLVHAFDMVRRTPRVEMPVEAIEPATEQGDLLETFAAREPAPAPAPLVVDELPEFAELPVEPAVETGKKRNRKAPKPAESSSVGRRLRQVAEPMVADIVEEAAPMLAEPEVAAVVEEAAPELAEPQPELRVVDSTPDEPEYVPATPLFETEPFVRHQRAAFGRKAR